MRAIGRLRQIHGPSRRPAASGEICGSATTRPWSTRPADGLVLATDAAVAGVHADLAVVGLDDLGWKALTAAVSDLGAMGAVPRWALVTLVVPPRTDLDRLASGVAEASAAWACPVVGGDLTTADQVVVSVSVVGVLDGPRPAVTRAGAAGGDTLFVTGPLGASAAGLRLLRAGVRRRAARRRPPAAHPPAWPAGRGRPGRPARRP